MSILSKLTTDSGRDTPHVQAPVPAGAERFKKTVPVPKDGTVERITIWSVPGSEDALKLRPVIISDGAENDALTYAPDGEHFVTGEPDDTPYRVSIPVHQGDEVGVIVDNESADNNYRFRVQFEIDYAGGSQRLLGVFN
ncbi:MULTISPECIES: hypothetical protein [unclassified Haloferax]|uniref:hypothetical protein n=1 Tax=unclassified Haloferax TaxID=2625095 RepID=UPI002876816E|nr:MULTISPECIES: hypothetical protein [unclassified Haloferax]MDS0243939.1 hypothetical protein [Haloferax sp. S2CR25]MDS0447060.1 hypothetical protein [Haloferax sp. S2CR25-2]